MNWKELKPRLDYKFRLYTFKAVNAIWKAGAVFFDRLPGSASRYAKGARLLPVQLGDTPPWQFHSERCIRVLKRWEHRAALQKGDSISIIDDQEEIPNYIICGASTLDISSVPDGGDKWAYLYLNSSEFIWKNFVWSFTVRRESQFRELQFGFRYKDFYNRYRFRHENQTMCFDIVRNGRFSNNLITRPFAMECGRDYCFEITAVGKAIRLCVDGKEIIRAIDPSGSFSEGSIAMIFWEDDGKTPISVAISNNGAWNLRSA